MVGWLLQAAFHKEQTIQQVCIAKYDVFAVLLFEYCFILSMCLVAQHLLFLFHSAYFDMFINARLICTSSCLIIPGQTSLGRSFAMMGTACSHQVRAQRSALGVVVAQ